jgi:hypothetical protein
VVRKIKNSKDTLWKKTKWLRWIIGTILVVISLIFVGPYIVNKIEINNSPGSIVTLNQTGGNNTVYNTNIKNFNVLTDKEALGIREQDGLYQNGTKVGRVINFVPNEKESTFTITEIDFDQPIRNQDTVWQPYEYQNYVIKIQNIERLVTIAPPGAEGVRGIILDRLKNNG